jgi:hypothetical protein
MKMFKAEALLYKADLKRMNYFQLGSLNPAINWQLTMYDARIKEEMRDPETGRIVDKLSWDEDDNGVRTQGLACDISYDSGFPYSGISAEVAGKFRVTQDGPTLDEGDKYRILFDVFTTT